MIKPRIAHKIGLLVVGAVILAGVVIGVLVYTSSFNVLLEHERVDLADESKVRAEAFLEHIGTLRSDVLYLAGLPEVEDVARASRSDAAGEGQAAEPETGESLKAMQSAVESKLMKLCGEQHNARPYLKIELIGSSNSGRALLGVKRHGEASDAAFESMSSNELQRHGDRDYYRETASLSPQQVYIDDFECLSDGGKQPPRVLRAAAPIFGSRPDGEAALDGIVLITLDFDFVARESLQVPRFRTYLANEYGQYLIHPRPEREFAFRTQDKDRPGAKSEGAADAHVTTIKDDETLEDLQSEMSDETIFDQADPWSPTLLTQDEIDFRQRGHRFQRAFSLKSEKDQLRIVRLIVDVNRVDRDKTLRSLERKLQKIDDREYVMADRRIAPGTREVSLSAPADAAGREELDKAVDELTRTGLLTKKKGYPLTAKNFYGHYHRLHFDPLHPKRHLGLLMAMSNEEQKAELRDTWVTAANTVGLVVLGVAGVAVWFSMLLTKRLGRIRDAADAIASGNMTPDLSFSGRDEIGDLARGFHRMIAEVKSREDQVLEREAKLRLVFDAAAEGVLLVDENDLITRANPACCNLFDYASEELIGKSVFDLFDAEAQQSIHDTCRTVVGTHDMARLCLEAVGMKKTGTVFPLEVSVGFVDLGGQVLRTFILRDITERKQAKQLLEKEVAARTVELREANEELKKARDKAQELSHAKDAFLASVSHELRNPLNQVFGFCQLLELSDLDDAQKEDLTKIRGASSHLLALINDILDYQKIVMGGIGMEPETFDVGELVEEVQQGVAVQPNEEGNLFAVDCQANVGSMTADKRRVRQVLLNLVSNGLKFTSKGRVTLRVRRQARDDGDWIVMAVADTGRGMTPEEQAKLFRPFQKLAAKAGNRTGTGLGLVICQGLCKLMGGQILVRSEYGVGSQFTIELPALTKGGAAARVDEAVNEALLVQPPSPTLDVPAATTFGNERAPLSGRPGRMVLVIDDDANQREVMDRYLSSCGYQVALAASGVEGIQLAQRLQPAAITLDVLMPELDGWSVLAALKGDDRTRTIPVVITTVMPRDEAINLRGATDFFCKPIDWQSLAAALGKYVNGQYDRSVLVVDDEAGVRQILRRFLERDNWSVIEASHGAEAIEALSRGRPAAIILDLVMPVMDGFAFLAELSQHEDWLSIPIVVHTAKDLTAEEMARLKGMVVRLLRKGEGSTAELVEELRQQLLGSVSGVS